MEFGVFFSRGVRNSYNPPSHIKFKSILIYWRLAFCRHLENGRTLPKSTERNNTAEQIEGEKESRKVLSTQMHAIM